MCLYKPHFVVKEDRVKELEYSIVWPITMYYVLCLAWHNGNHDLFFISKVILSLCLAVGTP